MQLLREIKAFCHSFGGSHLIQFLFRHIYEADYQMWTVRIIFFYSNGYSYTAHTFFLNKGHKSILKHGCLHGSMNCQDKGITGPFKENIKHKLSIKTQNSGEMCKFGSSYKALTPYNFFFGKNFKDHISWMFNPSEPFL